LDCKVYGDIYRAIDDLITEDEDNLPGFARLSFHDCVGKSCDGCLNLKDSSNAGLDEYVEALEPVYEKFHKVISRADLWQLAGQVAFVRGGLNKKCDAPLHHKCVFFDMEFWWGRKDCHTSPNYLGDDDAGDAHGDFHEVHRILYGDFGLNDREIVAVLGAHSLGGAHRHSSGFNYHWQHQHTTFDNQYYKNLISLKYFHENVAEDVEEGERADPNEPPKLEFVNEDIEDQELLMLNTDISLFKKVKAIEAHGEYTGQLKCPLKHKHDVYITIDEEPDVVSKCEEAHTAPIVYEFAHNLDKFYDAFEDVWWKVSSHGYKHLKKVGHCASCIPEGAYCVNGFEKSGLCCHGTICINNKCT
jgi:hypothetical protein